MKYGGGKNGQPENTAIVCVQTEARALEVMQQCEHLGSRIIVGIEPDKPEDTTNLEKRSMAPHRFTSRKSVLTTLALAAAG